MLSNITVCALQAVKTLDERGNDATRLAKLKQIAAEWRFQLVPDKTATSSKARDTNPRTSSLRIYSHDFVKSSKQIL